MSDDPGDVFADVPLFREIQKLLASSSGPVNWELARQIGIATASAGGAVDPEPSAADRDGLADAVRVAELKISELTGLPAPGNIVPVEAVRRGEWVQANIDGLRALAEPAAAKVAGAFAAMQPRHDDDSGSFTAAFGQVIALLLGMQAGSVLGGLAGVVFGQYDVAVPRPGRDRVLFVVPNIVAFEKDWSLPPIEFRQWVALHEVTHRFEFARPWARPHLESLITDFTSTLEVDASAMQERLEQLDVMTNPEAVKDLMQSDVGLFDTVLDDEQRLKLARIQAFMAAAEGYGDHVAHTIGRSMLGAYPQIDEALRRHRENETGDAVFERLLGIEMKRDQFRLGRRFCDTVAGEAGEVMLAHMWDSADALPSMPELSEPLLWMARSA